MKQFNILYNVGKSKYVINIHDGVKKHKDGSPFYDVDICKSKKDFFKKISNLINQGYKESK